MTYPYASQPFWELRVWTSDAKAVEITSLGPIIRTPDVSGEMNLDEPYQFTISLALSDKYTQNLGKGHWVELSAGKTSPRTMVAWGNIQHISKSRSGKTLTLQLTSSMIALSTSSVMGYHQMNPHDGFKTLTDYFNGVGTGKNQWGYLHGTGWTASWLDGTQGTVNTTAPGNQGHKRAASWSSVLQTVKDLAGFYDFHIREGNDPRPGHTSEPSKLKNGHLVCGPFYDDSGLVIWGGQPLLSDMKAKGLLPSWANQPNTAIAQQNGYAVIDSVDYEDDLSHILNCIWAIGRSDPNLVTLESFNGGVPSNSFEGSGTNGWAVYTPPDSPASNGRKFYIKTNSATTYSGTSYYLIASQTTSDDWAYGVLNKTSADTYGIYETTYQEEDAAHPEDLLAATIAKLEWNSSDVPSFTFGVKHPMTSADGVPRQPKPGQKVTINYSDRAADAIDLDQNSGSASFGQPTSIGGYAYLDYPGVPTTDPRYKKMTKCVGVSFHWSAAGYEQTLTMGRGQWRSKKQGLLIAKQMEKNLRKKHHKHTFAKVSFEHIPFLLSQNPDAWEDISLNALGLSPGAIAVADVRKASYFTDHSTVKFTFAITEPTQKLRLWLAKRVDGKLTDPNPGVVYALYQFAGTGTGAASGFFSTIDGTNLTKRGTVPRPGFANAKRQLAVGTYVAEVSHSGSTYQCKLSAVGKDGVHRPFIGGGWHDTNVGGNQVIQAYGSIGWELRNGKSAIMLTNVHANPHVKKSRVIEAGEQTLVPADHIHRTKRLHESGAYAVTTHRRESFGATLQRVSHGIHLHQATATVSGVSSATTNGITVTTLTFDAPVQKNAIRLGWTLFDAAGNEVQVRDINADRKSRIVSVTTTTPNTITAGTALEWDPLEEGDAASATIAGHYYDDDKRRGWGIHITPPDAPAGSQFSIYPDGTVQQGDTITQIAGQTVSLGNLAIGGEHLAKALEGHGAILFDAAEFDSTSQQAIPYANTTAGTTITPDTANFYGGAPGTIQASWVSKTATNPTTGVADAILQITTSGAASSIRWFDNQTIDHSGTQRSFALKEDVTFNVPLFLDTTNVTTSAETMGSSTQLTKDATAGTNVIYPRDEVGTIAASPGDTLTVNPGGSTAETLTVQSVDANANSITFTSNLASTHVTGETVVHATSGGAIVHSGGTLGDGWKNLSSVVPNVNAVVIGYYDGSAWYRGWWGNASWVCPWATGLRHLGPLTITPGTWQDLSCKASDLGLNPTKVGINLQGVELALAAPSGVTLYCDAHHGGFTTGVLRTPVGGVTGGTIPPATIGAGHQSPSNPGAQTHDGITYWNEKISGTWHLFWESGSFRTQDGVTKTINGTTEDAPTGGISPVLSGQTTPGTNYLAFNTTSSSMTLFVPADGSGWVGGNIVIPAYSAAGGSGGQSTGFGVLPQTFDWTKRPGGGSAKVGPPKGLYKLGQFSSIADIVRGEYPIQSILDVMKGYPTSTTRAGSTTRREFAVASPGKYTIKGTTFKFSGTVAASAPYTWTATMKWGSSLGTPTIVDDTGQVVATLGTGSTMTVHNDDIICWDRVTSAITRSDGYSSGVAPDLNSKANVVRYLPLGQITSGKDPINGQLSLGGWHPGGMQAQGDHLGDRAAIAGTIKFTDLNTVAGPLDSWSTTGTGAWVSRAGFGTALQSSGTLTGGNTTGLSATGTNATLEWRLWNGSSSSTGAWSNWIPVVLWKTLPGSQPADSRDNGYENLVVFNSVSLTALVEVAKPMTDGSLDVLMWYIATNALAFTGKIQFRVTYAVSAT